MTSARRSSPAHAHPSGTVALTEPTRAHDRRAPTKPAGTAAQSLAGSGLASLSSSGDPPTAGTPSPAFVHNNSIVAASST